MFNNKPPLSIVEYHTELPVVKKGHSLSADDLVQNIKLIFAECGLLNKIILDAGTNFTSEMFKHF